MITMSRAGCTLAEAVETTWEPVSIPDVLNNRPRRSTPWRRFDWKYQQGVMKQSAIDRNSGNRESTGWRFEPFQAHHTIVAGGKLGVTMFLIIISYLLWRSLATCHSNLVSFSIYDRLIWPPAWLQETLRLQSLQKQQSYSSSLTYY